MKTKLTIQDWGLMIGQKVKWKNKNFYLLAVDMHRLSLMAPKGKNTHYAHIINDKPKPILRTLDQMIEEEKKEFAKIFHKGYEITNIFESSIFYKKCGGFKGEIEHDIKSYDWLTQKGFDVRGWIDAELAIREE